jgi:PAS domain S-box-containing protein
MQHPYFSGLHDENAVSTIRNSTEKMRIFRREGAAVGDSGSRAATEHPHNRMDTFLAGQNLILEKIAAGADLPDVLTSLVQLIELQAGGMLCSILLLDEDGVHLRHGAAPSLPESYIKAIDGSVIGPKAGSCGTAVYFGKPVVVTDILTDALWDDYRDLAVKHGLRACWSSPILLHTGQVSGTFAMYYRVPRGPSPEEQRLTQTATHIASIAIERQRAEQALRESEERSRAILRAIPDSIFLLDSDCKYLDCQPRSSCQAKIPHDKLVGKNMRDVLPPELADKFVRSFQVVSKSGEPQLVEYDSRINGQMRYSEGRVVFTSDRKFLVVVRDITERKLAEEALRKREKELSRSHAKIRELAGKLMSAQEEERRRISRELHDDLNQKVAALSIMISTITHQLALEESLRNQLEMVHTYSAEIADGIHRLSHELHPAVLEHVGLPAALRAYVAEFSRLENIRVELTVSDAVEAIPHDAAVCLYRIAQESLRNIVKHSGADHAEMTLTMDERAVCLHVIDSGSGFDLSSARNNGGLGLASMEERIRLVQGSFRISTQPGGGSKLLATIPLRK